MVKRLHGVLLAMSMFLLAFLVFSQQGSVSAATDPGKGKSATVSADYAFVSVVNSGVGVGTGLTGDLNIHIDSRKQVEGALITSDGVKISVRGSVTPLGQLTFTLLVDPKHHIVIQGFGGLNTSNIYAGQFQQFSGSSVLASGIWSAQYVVSPKQSVGHAFVGHISSGPDAGQVVTAALVENTATGTTIANLPDGRSAPVVIVRTGLQVNVVIQLGGSQQVIATGTTYNGNLSGNFVGYATNDNGLWQDLRFTFGAR